MKMDKISREIEELRLDNQNMIKSPSSSTSSTDDADVGKKPPVHFFLQNPENTNAVRAWPLPSGVHMASDPPTPYLLPHVNCRADSVPGDPLVGWSL